jgi:hypothetical protein
MSVLSSHTRFSASFQPPGDNFFFLSRIFSSQQMRSLLIFPLYKISFFFCSSLETLQMYKRRQKRIVFLSFIISTLFSLNFFSQSRMESINWIIPEKLHLAAAAKCENNDDTSGKHFVSWRRPEWISNDIAIEYDTEINDRDVRGSQTEDKSLSYSSREIRCVRHFNQPQNGYWLMHRCIFNGIEGPR